MARIVGIDLGTTNSLVAYMEDGRPTVVAGRNGRPMVPSVVAMTDNGLIVGDPAKEHLNPPPEWNGLFRQALHGKGTCRCSKRIGVLSRHSASKAVSSESR